MGHVNIELDNQTQKISASINNRESVRKICRELVENLSAQELAESAKVWASFGIDVNIHLSSKIQQEDTLTDDQLLSIAGMEGVDPLEVITRCWKDDDAFETGAQFLLDRGYTFEQIARRVSPGDGRRIKCLLDMGAEVKDVRSTIELKSEYINGVDTELFWPLLEKGASIDWLVEIFKSGYWFKTQGIKPLLDYGADPKLIAFDYDYWRLCLMDADHSIDSDLSALFDAGLDPYVFAHYCQREGTTYHAAVAMVGREAFRERDVKVDLKACEKRICSSASDTIRFSRILASCGLKVNTKKAAKKIAKWNRKPPVSAYDATNWREVLSGYESSILR